MIKDDIGFIQNSNYRFYLKYNTKINNLKYVAVSNIISTIGGKYPTIYNNGNVKYRQFNISGQFGLDIEETVTSTDSLDSLANSGRTQESLEILEDCFNNISKGTESCLQIATQNGENSENLYVYGQNIDDRQNPIDRVAVEKKFIQYIVNLLTDGRPKYMYLPTEGNMIVILSGVSFTYNENLAVANYSYTATVTEICSYDEYIHSFKQDTNFLVDKYNLFIGEDIENKINHQWKNPRCVKDIAILNTGGPRT